MSSTTELNADFFPSGILNIPQDLLQFNTHGDDPNRIRVCLTEDCTNTGDLLCGRKRKLFRVNNTVLSDVFGRLGLDLL